MRRDEKRAEGRYRSPEAKKSSATVKGTSGAGQFCDTISNMTWCLVDEEKIKEDEGGEVEGGVGGGTGLTESVRAPDIAIDDAAM